MVQEFVQDFDIAENENHKRFQRPEDLIRGLTVVVEKMSCRGKISNDVSVMNKGSGTRGEEDRGHSVSSLRWRKLDIPDFAGEEAYGWTNRVEETFQVEGSY